MKTTLQTTSLTKRTTRLTPAVSNVGRRRMSQVCRIENGDGKVTREYREDDDALYVGGKRVDGGGDSQDQVERAAAQAESQAYVEIPRKEMSDAMKEKLRREYYGLGGSPNKPMNSNYFLNIILVIAVLAMLSAFLGYV